MRAARLLGAALCGVLAVGAVASVETGTGTHVARSFLHIAPAASVVDGAGLTPDDIASAYGLVGGSTGMVAIATAYSDPHLEADLAVYRSTFGLAPCTSASGCLTIVGQAGTSTLPKANASWGEETSLDVDAVSAACPDCRILVVEASSDSIDDLGSAVNTAVRLGATAVSASWGDTEWSGWSADSARYFTHRGVPIVAATGDDGWTQAVFPAAMPNVIAVGGTTLTSTGGGASPLTVQRVDGGTVTTATTSTTIAKDRAVLAAAKKALATAKHRVTTAKNRLKHARLLRTRATSSHDALHWQHRVRDLTKALAAARKAASTASKRVSAAEGTLLKDVLRESSAKAAARARLGQTDRAGWIETAWEGAGSGCSSVVARPGWQAGTTCAKRGTADIAADADPQTGIATYDSYGTSKDTDDGWMVAGGTSLAAPLVAAMLVRSGDAASYDDAQRLYTRSGSFWDITGGSNGDCGTALCEAGVGYDGPTGIGTPMSLASF